MSYSGVKRVHRAISKPSNMILVRFLSAYPQNEESDVQ